MFTCLRTILLNMLYLLLSHWITLLKLNWWVCSWLWIHSIIHWPREKTICLLCILWLLTNVSCFRIYAVNRLTAVHRWIMLRLILRGWNTFVSSLSVLIWLNQCHVLNIHHVKFWSWSGRLGNLVSTRGVDTLPLEVHILAILSLIMLLLYWSLTWNGWIYNLWRLW